jgi:hypothetical protein
MELWTQGLEENLIKSKKDIYLNFDHMTKSIGLEVGLEVNLLSSTTWFLSFI